MNELVYRGVGSVDLGHVRRCIDLDLDVDEWHAKGPRIVRDGLRFVGRDRRLLLLGRGHLALRSSLVRPTVS